MGRFYPHNKTIYLPTPSWGNHTPIFRDSGLEVKQYRYFDKKTVGLDFEGLKEDLKVNSHAHKNILRLFDKFPAEYPRKVRGTFPRMCPQSHGR